MVTQQDQYLTAEQPMGGWFDKARDFEQLDGVLDVSPYPMQPWLDVQEAGWSVVVTTEGDPHLATRLAREMGEWAWDRREEFMINERHAVAHAVAEAINTKQDEQIVILSDTGDSVYGGAPGDSTVILRELLAQQASAPASDASAGLLMLPVVDPQVVELAVQRWATSSSSDATLPPGVMLGGKVDSVFSSPVDVGRAKVLAIWDGTPSHVADIRHAVLPQCALLGLGRVRIAVMAEPTGGVNHPSLYESLGITVSDAAAIVLKTASNFQYFDDWSSRVLRVDTAGMTQSNLQAFDWVRAPRPIFPLDAAAAF
jgi:microcystin degradation protein MlrC